MKKEKKVGKSFWLFNKTNSGASKFALFIMGIILGVASSTLFGYMCGNYNASGDFRYYDWLIFVAIFLLIFTGELIGIYFGAYEQFEINRKQNEKEQETKEDVKKISEEKKEEKTKKSTSNVKRTKNSPPKTEKTVKKKRIAKNISATFFIYISSEMRN